MAWTTKSREPQASRSRAKASSSVLVSSTSQGRQCEAPSDWAEGFALIGEGQLGALLGQALGDAPRDGVVVGDAHDEAALPAHEPLRSTHAPLHVTRSLESFRLDRFQGSKATTRPRLDGT